MAETCQPCLARLMSCCLSLALSHVSIIWMMSRVSSCLSVIWNILARLVSWHLRLGKCLCLGKKRFHSITDCKKSDIEHDIDWYEHDQIDVGLLRKRGRKWTELLELEAVSLLTESVDSSTQMVLDVLNVIMMLHTYTCVKHQKSWNESEVLAQGD